MTYPGIVRRKGGRKISSVKISKEKMEAFLEKYGFTKKELGEMIGYSRESISKAINRGQMDLLMIVNICIAFGVHPDEILDKIAFCEGVTIPKQTANASAEEILGVIIPEELIG